MVAFSSSRRQLIRPFPQRQANIEGLAASGEQSPAAAATAMAASRRGAVTLEVLRSPGGSIESVRIGSWRTLTGGPQRQIAEVKQLPSERIAVRIERFADSGGQPSSEIWQLYDLQGRLEAALQSTPNGAFAILTDYRTRQSCRLVRNGRSELEPAETWRI